MSYSLEHLMYNGQRTVMINEEEEPTRCYLVFYYTYDRLNMFRAPLCPSSGAHNYAADYHMGRLILRSKNQTAHIVISGIVVSS
jgi:hypothetical protein